MVVDSNVVISSILWGGASYRVMRLIANGKVKAYTTEQIKEELSEVLKHFRYKTPIAKQREILELYDSVFEIVNVDTRIGKAEDLEDPKDQKFLDCAGSVSADYLITGDNHLLKLRNFREIRIVTPAAFLREM